MQEKYQKSLSNRLSRIEGQVRGINKMISEGKYCIDIITQISAIKSSLSGVESIILENHLEEHLGEKLNSSQRQQAIDEIIKVFKKK
jgi:DNA-binding FrmR family transcriptional regulator